MAIVTWKVARSLGVHMEAMEPMKRDYSIKGEDLSQAVLDTVERMMAYLDTRLGERLGFSMKVQWEVTSSTN